MARRAERKVAALIPPGLRRSMSDALRFWGISNYPTNDYQGIIVTWRGHEYEIRAVK